MSEYDKILKSAYGAKNIKKVMRNSVEGPKESKRRFIKKYPDADVNKFEFDVELGPTGDITEYIVSYKISDGESYDITSETFLNNKDLVKYLTINKWPKIWSADGSVPKFCHIRYPSNPFREDFGHHKVIDVKFQKPVGLDYNPTKFKIYVNNNDFFMSNFESIKARWSTGKKLDENLEDITEVKFKYKSERIFRDDSGYLCFYILVRD